MSIIIGTIIAVSSSSWFRIWIGLEINLLSFIPLITRSKNLFSSEASLKYFITQALASAILLFSVILIYFFLKESFREKYFLTLISSTIILKIGAAPFHFWFPSVIEGLNWYRNIILLSWQKIAPILILSYCINLNLLILIIFLSIFFGSLGGLNQTSLRKLIAFSSINHIGWIIIALIFNELLWSNYFIFYVLLSLFIIFIFNNLKILNLRQTFNLSLNKIIKIFIFRNLLSLGGLPPFLGFMPKWLVIEIASINNIFFILTFILFFTLITLFFYLRISYTAFLINHKTINWNFKNYYSKKNFIFMIIISTISIFGLTAINLLYYFI